MGSTIWVTIAIMLLAYHLASGQFIPSQEYFCIHIMVHPLWGYLWFFIQYGKCFGILQFVLIQIVLSTPSSTKSLTSAQGSSFWCRDAMNELHSALHSSSYHFSWVSALYVDI